MAAAMPVGQIKSQNHNDCLSYLESLGDAQPQEVADELAAKIRNESNNSNANSINQAALNVTFRVYYHIIHKYELEDKHFADLPEGLSCKQTEAFLMLQAVLLTDHWARLDAQLIEAKCTDAIIAALAENRSSLVHILKAANLLVKKFPKLELVGVKLEHFYHCLQRQAQTGSREETLTLYNHCCKQQTRAFAYFRIIVEFLPWSNRNKYYLLSGILNSHGLPELLDASDHSQAAFFAGLRRSLNYKALRAASQYPIKSLSNQRSEALLEMAVELLVNGSTAEVQNFYSQWFLRIQQRDELFHMLQAKPEIVEFLTNVDAMRRVQDLTAERKQRLIIIFSMFAKEIFAVSKVHFFKISTELLTNCSSYEPGQQLMMFKFMVENLANFAVEDCLEFFFNFIKRHRNLASAEFRNTILGKMPNIINHTAKHFSRALKANAGAVNDSLAQDIKRFFGQLQELVENDMRSDVYQPKIFALKMLEILHKSLYSEQVVKNAKMCSIQQNQQLGAFLIERRVFQPGHVAKLLFDSLNNPQGFDDAMELSVSLLLQLGHVDVKACVKRCLEVCTSSDVDECALVSLYAQLAVRNFPGDSPAKDFYDTCLDQLMHKLEGFEKDPLLTTKSAGGHLFGHLCALDELIGGPQRLTSSQILELLPLLERILNVILKFLNLANAKKENAGAASFQDMDESLQLLVSESAQEAVEDAEAARKFLLMSFWLTLKAICDLATSLGCSLLRSEHTAYDKNALQRCLDINVAVLTRCRHKGAIEAAGLSIGKLTRAITSTLPSEDPGFQMLQDCLDRELLTESRQVSTTRRGAGFSIMFLHVLKNDDPRKRLLLHRAVGHILERLKAGPSIGAEAAQANGSSNHDRWEALALHYLCVLVRDTELRMPMSQYYSDILLVAMAHIDNTEWTISNGALQLFGAAIGKLVGQRQATEFATKLEWEPCEMCFEELVCQLPEVCEHMMDHCDNERATFSIILFLSFLSKVEHLCITGQPQKSTPLLHRFRRLSWRLLYHSCEQVRQLAAVCFVRAHEFRCALPSVLLASADLVSTLCNENFFEGIVYVLHAGVLKLEHESVHVWVEDRLSSFKVHLLSNIDVATFDERFKVYSLKVLLKLLLLLNGADEVAIVREMVEMLGRERIIREL